jgi:hypothetical protein
LSPAFGVFLSLNSVGSMPSLAAMLSI